MKHLFILLAILFISITTTAQKVSLGPELGVNIIPLESTGYGYNYQLGFHFGAHLKYHFSPKFRLTTGLYLTQKKKAYSYTETSSVLGEIDKLLGAVPGGIGGGNPLGGINLDSIIDIPGINLDMTEDVRGVNSEIFIKIPLLANYKYKNVNFYLGPYFGLLLTASQKEEITTKVPVFDFIDISALDSSGFISGFLPKSGVGSNTSSGTDGLSLVDIGANIGIGYQMNQLHFNLMYSHGFIDSGEAPNGTTLSPLRTFRVSMVYLFDFKKVRRDAPSID